MEKQFIKIIKEKSNLVRDMVQRKMCVVVFGVKEMNLPMKIAREKEEAKRAKEIIAETQNISI